MNKGWFREVAKLCLNSIVGALVVFVFGFANNPTWSPKYLLVGGAAIVILLVASYYLWRAGGE